MDSRRDLQSTGEYLPQLLRGWRSLAEQQTIAIQAGDWTHLAQLGIAKEQLEMAIDEAVASATPPESAVIRELIDLEQRNSELLAERCRQARTALGQLAAAVGQLRRVQGAYARGNRSHWQAYS